MKQSELSNQYAIELNSTNFFFFLSVLSIVSCRIVLRVGQVRALLMRMLVCIRWHLISAISQPQAPRSKRSSPMVRINLFVMGDVLFFFCLFWCPLSLFVCVFCLFSFHSLMIPFIDRTVFIFDKFVVFAKANEAVVLSKRDATYQHKVRLCPW